MIDAPGADCVVVSVTVFPWVVVVTVFPGVVTVFAGVVDGSVLDALVCPVPDEIDFVTWFATLETAELAAPEPQPVSPADAIPSAARPTATDPRIARGGLTLSATRPREP